jgi:hypothetical protein
MQAAKLSVSVDVDCARPVTRGATARPRKWMCKKKRKTSARVSQCENDDDQIAFSRPSYFISSRHHQRQQRPAVF